MAASVNLDHHRLQRSTPYELVLYYRQLTDDYTVEAVTEKLIILVKYQITAPDTVYVWLKVTKSPAALAIALKQTFSVSIRRSAIALFAKLHRTNVWKDLWDGLGGTQGIVHLLEQFSIRDVQHFFRQLKLRSISPNDDNERSKQMSELIRALDPKGYPKAPFSTTDERPIYSVFKSLQLCDTDFVNEVLHGASKEDVRRINSAKLVAAHYDLFRSYTLKDTDQNATIQSRLVKLLVTSSSITWSNNDLSCSMSYSIEYLTQVLNDLEFTNWSNLLGTMLHPLVRKAWNYRKKIGLDHWNNISELCGKVLERIPKSLLHTIIAEKGFLQYMILAQPHHIGEATLVQTLHLFTTCTVECQKQHFFLILQWVRWPIRYKLLRLLFRHWNRKNIDIENVEDLKKIDTRFWLSKLFFELDRESALALLSRLYDIHGSDFMDTGIGNIVRNTVLGQNSDVATLVFGLLGEPKYALDKLDKKKKMAMQSRDVEDRAIATQSFMTTVVATGSLKQYEDALIWSKRFIKDQTTASRIFSRSFVKEAAVLLSGIPSYSVGDIEDFGPEEIQARILHANRIIREQFEIFCSALKESHFALTDWSGLLWSLKNAFRVRIERARDVILHLQMSFDETYELLFQPTLTLALELEQLSLQPGLKDKCQYVPNGPIDAATFLGLLKGPSLDVCLRFIDELARGRNTIWEEHRLAEMETIPIPDITIMAQGLPVQRLLGSLVSERHAAGKTPYLFARSAVVVFSEPQQVLLPLDEEVEYQRVVPLYVESYRLCLQIYIEQSPDGKVQIDRMNKAWNHALGLNLTRMDKPEAERFLAPIFLFLGYLPFVTNNLPTVEMIEHPTLPLPNSDIMEWNPFDGMGVAEKVKSRPLKLTYLDCALNSEYTNENAYWRWHSTCPRPQTESYIPPQRSLWDLNLIWTKNTKRTPSLRDGMVVSALLYIDSKIKSPSSILSRPYPPSDKSVRYPALYLADEILQCDEFDLYGAYRPIEHFIKQISPRLLQDITESALEASNNSQDSPDEAEVQQLAFFLLKMLKWSDNPSLAIPLILDVVLNHPEASSWHRQLLTIGFLETLSTAQSEKFITSFSDEVQKRLQSQAERRKAQLKVVHSTTGTTDSSATNTNSPETFVKISTVKQLVTYLGDSKYVPRDRAIDILGGLLKSSSHIEVRSAVLESLFSLLNNASPAQGDRIIQVLKLMIPVLGSLNEFQPPSEEDWEEAERTITPLPIQESSEIKYRCRNIPPLLQLLLTRCVISNYIPAPWKKKIFHQILMPIIEQSIKANTRWLNIFAKKYRIDLDDLNVPMLPIDPEVLLVAADDETFALSPNYRGLFGLYQCFVMANLSPWEELRDFNKSLEPYRNKKDPEIRHWLSLYGRYTSMWENGHDSATDGKWLALKILSWKENATGIQLETVESACFNTLKCFVLEYPTHSYLSTLMSCFRYCMATTVNNEDPEWNQYEQEWNTLTKTRAIVQRIIKFIDDTRTPEWQRNRNRHPAILPDTFEYELWLLPYPSHLETGQVPDPAEIRTFSTAIKQIVADLCSKNQPYHKKLPILQKAVDQVRPYHRAAIAVELGRIDGSLKLEDYLRLEIAESLFKNASKPRVASVVDEARQIIAIWQNQSDEIVRLAGRRLGEASLRIFEGEK